MMKKIFIAILFITSMNAYAQDDAKTPIAIPKFAHPKVQQFVKEYLEVMKQGMNLKNNPKSNKAAEQYMKRAERLTNKAQEVTKILASSPDEMKKFSDFMVKLTNYYYPNSSKNKPVKSK